MPHEYTKDECRGLFLREIWSLINYWDNQEYERRESLEGLAHSILAIIDGENMSLPHFMLTPVSHADDKEYYEEIGENWWPVIDYGEEQLYDIGGPLHNLLFGYEPGRKDG